MRRFFAKGNTKKSRKIRLQSSWFSKRTVIYLSIFVKMEDLSIRFVESRTTGNDFKMIYYQIRFRKHWHVIPNCRLVVLRKKGILFITDEQKLAFLAKPKADLLIF